MFETGDDFTKSLDGIYDKQKVVEALEGIGEDLVDRLRDSTEVDSDGTSDHLRDQWRHRIASVGGRDLLIVGARYPEGGHSHLVEDGFDHIGGKRIKGKHLIQKAVDGRESKTDEDIQRVI